VTNSFPLPHSSGDDDEKSSKTTSMSYLIAINRLYTPVLAGRYQTAMLRALKEVRADDSVVGFYQSTTMGAFFSQTLVDTQAVHQEKLRHGGVVVVHGIASFFCRRRN
jgi:translation initiation factor 3 subunit H